MSLGPLAFHWLTLLQDLIGLTQFPILAFKLFDTVRRENHSHGI